MSESVSRDAILARLADIRERYNQVIQEMSSPEIATDPGAMQKLGREQAELSPTVALYERFLNLEREIQDAQSLLEDGADADMRAFVREEIEGDRKSTRLNSSH